MPRDPESTKSLPRSSDASSADRQTLGSPRRHQPDTETTNIIVDDFDSIKRRICKEIEGHRTDLVLAALRSILDDVSGDVMMQRAKEIHAQLMKDAP